MSLPPYYQQFTNAPQIAQQQPSAAAALLPIANRIVNRYDTIEALKGQEAYDLSTMVPPTEMALYLPGMQVRMVSALQPTSLKAGEFSLLQNIRPDFDSLQARYPTTLFGSTATTFNGTTPPSGILVPRGIWSGNLNGAQYVVTAWGLPGGSVSTTLNGNVSAGASSIVIASATGVTAGMSLGISGGGNSETVTVSNAYTSGTTIPIQNPLVNFYSSGATVVSVVIALYTSTNGHAFTEITSTNSPYGYTGQNTSSRFPDSGSLCSFQSVTNTNPAGVNEDVLIIQNGASFPMIYRTTPTHGAYIFPIQNITAPTVYETTAPTLTAGKGFDFNSGGTYTATNKTSGGAPQSFFEFIGGVGSVGYGIESGALAGDTMLCQSPSSSVFFILGTQLCMILNSSSDAFSVLATLKLEVLDTSSVYHTVYDPDAGIGAPPTTVAIDQNINNNAAVVMVWNQVNLAGVECMGIRFTAPSTFVAPVNGTGGIVFAVYAGGLSSIPSGAALAVSYFNSATLTESPGVDLPPAVNTPTYTSVGMYAGYIGNLPADGSLFYDLQIPTIPSGQYASGVDTLNLYLADVGSTTYGYSQGAPIASYSGTWSSSTGTATASGVPVDTYVSPDAFSCAMPQGTCMAAGGGRSFVGVGSTYWFSEYGYPLRFRLILDVEQNVPRAGSGGYATLPNTEKVAAFAVAGAAALGTSNLFLFSNASTYNISGPDGLSLSSPSLLASVGCSAPDSVALYQDSIYFLDDNYEIRKFGYGQSQLYYYANVNSYQLMIPISKRVVDDQTRSIPGARVSSVVGCAGYDRYYMAYSPPSGSSNTYVLVWDETIGSFVRDTPTVGTATVEAMCPTVVGGLKAIACQSADGQVYVWENTTSNNPVAVTVTTRSQIAPPNFTKTFFGRIGLTVDVQASQTATITKTLIAGGNPYGTVTSETTSIDLSTGVNGPQVWRFDSKTLEDETTGPAGQSARACQLSIAIPAMTPATNIYEIIQEQEQADPGRDAL